MPIRPSLSPPPSIPTNPVTRLVAPDYAACFGDPGGYGCTQAVGYLCVGLPVAQDERWQHGVVAMIQDVAQRAVRPPISHLTGLGC